MGMKCLHGQLWKTKITYMWLETAVLLEDTTRCMYMWRWQHDFNQSLSNWEKSVQRPKRVLWKGVWKWELWNYDKWDSRLWRCHRNPIFNGIHFEFNITLNQMKSFSDKWNTHPSKCLQVFEAMKHCDGVLRVHDGQHLIVPSQCDQSLHCQGCWWKQTFEQLHRQNNMA